MIVFIITILFACVLFVGPIVALTIPLDFVAAAARYGVYGIGALFTAPFIIAAVYIVSIGFRPLGFLRPRTYDHHLDIEQFFIHPVHIAAARLIQQVMSDYINRSVTHPEMYSAEAARDFRRYFHMTEIFRDRGFQFHWRMGTIDPQAMRILADDEQKGAVVEYTGECQYWVERDGKVYQHAADHPVEGIVSTHSVIRLQYTRTAHNQLRLLAWEDTALQLHLHEITL